MVTITFRIHPELALTYRKRIATQIEGMSDPEGMNEAKDALRGLMARILLRPNEETSRLSVELERDPSGLIVLAVRANEHPKCKNPLKRFLKHMFWLVS